MKKIILILSIILFIQCSDISNTKDHYYSDGRLFYTDYFKNGVLTERKTYSLKGDLIAFINFKNGKFCSSSVYNDNIVVGEYISDKNNTARYHQNAPEMSGRGKIDDFSREIGWWRFYDENRKLAEKRYSILVNGDRVINQYIIYKENGSVDSLNSVFSDAVIKNKIDKNTYNAELVYRRRIHKDSYVSLILSEEIKDDFSNSESVKYDTIMFNTSKKMKFPLKIKNSGVKKLRGFIIEQYSKEKFVKNKLVELEEFRIHFEKIITVNKDGSITE